MNTHDLHQKENKKNISTATRGGTSQSFAPIRTLEPTAERQVMLGDNYEVYEKIGPPTGATSFHYHDFYEIIYILEGDFDSEVDSRIYHLQKGDFLLIPGGVLHRYHPQEGEHKTSKRIILWVSPSYLDSLGAGQGDLHAAFHQSESAAWHFPAYHEERLRSMLLQLASTEEHPFKKLQDRGNLLLFFSSLGLLCNEARYIAQGELVERLPFVRQTDLYMEEHLTEPLPLELLAAKAHLSKYYFLRSFKEQTGMTVHQYLTQKRLLAACRLLESGIPITQVWGQVGFSDYSVFLRNFQAAFGKSPREYQKEHLAQ